MHFSKSNLVFLRPGPGPGPGRWEVQAQQGGRVPAADNEDDGQEFQVGDQVPHKPEEGETASKRQMEEQPPPAGHLLLLPLAHLLKGVGG